MPLFNREICLLGLAALLFGSSPGCAAEHAFAGRWSAPGQSSSPIGVIQYGETVALFAKAGWSIATLEPGTGGMLAVGDGKWVFDLNGQPIAVTVRIGQRGGRLYVLIAPEDTSGPSELKIIMDPVQTDSAHGRYDRLGP